MRGPRASLFLVCGLILVALASGAWAQSRNRVSDPCRREGDETACFLAHEEEFLDIYGLAKAADLVAQSTQVRRAMFIDGYGRNSAAVEFRRVAGHDPSVAVYLPRPDAEQGLAMPALEVPIPLTEWEATSARGRLFHRRLVGEDPPREEAEGEDPPREEAEGEETIRLCIHAWVYFVEVTDPWERDTQRRLRRRVQDASDDRLVKEYAIFLSEAAVRLIPACAALDPDNYRNAATILTVCGRFTGDRLAAAETYERIMELWNADDDSELRVLRQLFHNSVLVWDGETIERGVPEAWHARTSGTAPASYFTSSVHGESARRVRMIGMLERWEHAGENEILWRAPVEFIWALNDVSSFSIERATVGRFERVEGVCPPGLLTGAERANNCRR
jgi:hypothetical protein